jgi:fructose-1,6-bisphosphatase/inositol monophosphatase family enzyme
VALLTARHIDRVSDLIRETAEIEILPLFDNAGQLEVTEKSAGEIVTQADRNAERRLSEGLLAILPGSVVIGEETWQQAGPGSVGAFGDRPVWAVDPLDGTSAFVQGDPEFAVMVALILQGEALAAWVHAPVPGWMAVAELGSGAFLDGRRLRTANHVEAASMQGSVRLRFLPDDLRQTVIRAIPSFRRVALTGSAGWDHVAVANSERYFSLYHRTLVWDHAPGCLIVREAGGVVARLDGEQYEPLDDRTGLLTASCEDTWSMVRSMLLPPAQRIERQ